MLINIPSLSQLTVLTAMLYLNLFLLRFPIWYAARLGQPQVASFATLVVAFTNEWKMLIATSAFLLASNIGILQLPNVTTDKPLRTASFLSMALASISVLFSVILIFYFSTLRRAPIAAPEEGDESAERSADHPTYDWSIIILNNTENERCVWWNTSILVALPAIWASWSAIYFIVVFLLLVWYMHVEAPILPVNLVIRELVKANSGSFIYVAEYMPSVAVTVVILIGGVYLVLTVHTCQSLTERSGARG